MKVDNKYLLFQQPQLLVYGNESGILQLTTQPKFNTVKCVYSEEFKITAS